MKRSIEKDLLVWKNQPGRMPLLLRGARQVGKTYTITTFGQTHFANMLMINFEWQREYLPCFDTLDPTQIIGSINAINQTPIIPGKTLLFLDEIQECPQAIMALRYFKEKMPELHVIGAGSLLEFVINSENFRMPVGRVQSLYLKPFTFQEYLTAVGHESLNQYLSIASLDTPINLAVQQKLEYLLREYFIVGGMPAVIQHFIEHKNLTQCQMIQSSLLSTFRSDFGKYASQTKHRYLQRIFDQAPAMIGQHFRYAKVDPHMQSRDLKPAIENLVDAGIIHRVYHTAASGLPLNALTNEKIFKLLFLDIGLAKASSLLDAELMLQKDLMLINQGMLVEQFAGQELLANTPNYLCPQLFFWDREKRGSLAEVDYVIQLDDKILPIEVKSGKTGRLRSLQIFMEEKKVPMGICLSLKPLDFTNGILSVPLYMIHELKRLLSSILK